jgi:hypothetical protein
VIARLRCTLRLKLELATVVSGSKGIVGSDPQPLSAMMASGRRLSCHFGRAPPSTGCAKRCTVQSELG